MSLTNKTIANSYKDLLQMDNSNNGVDTTAKQVKDGEGTLSALFLFDDGASIRPVNDDSTSVFMVLSQDGSKIPLLVDTTNDLVKASGNIVNTQYATFSIGNTQSSYNSADTHHPIPFSNAVYGVSNLAPAFGTGTDPATTFTTADSNEERASDLVPCLWYVNDDISIDAIKSIEGADAATGDTTRMHLFSYDFTSGATSCLTNGTLLGHNSDVTNAGSEQPYLSTWTVDSAAVSAGKVILAFFKSDSINSDYSIQVTVKYHLT